MVTGDIKKINLSISSFERMINEGNLYVDKTRMIERFLTMASDVQLVARQRRLGKSLNMDMLRCFLTDKQDLRYLFKGLHIESSPVWDKVNSAPVFYYDFKGLRPENYKEKVYDMVCEHIEEYCGEANLSRAAKRYITNDNFDDTDGLLHLTESVYKATGKRSYLLIDEYDKLLMENYNTDKYEEIRAFETALLSAALKGNHYLEKALLTGIMRISHESMFSGLNNIVTFDVFNDDVYTDDYGLTDAEVEALKKLTAFDVDEVRAWYNGVRIGGKPIYNIYSVMSFLSRETYDSYWGKSGTMYLISDLLDDNRKRTLTSLLNGDQSEVPMSTRISLQHLSGSASDYAFYSLLVQAGYLALTEAVPSASTSAVVSIPNKELMIVWKEFLLETLYARTPQIKTLFDNADNLDTFSNDLEYFLRDRLSYHDLAVSRDDDTGRLHERLYHIFMLGILSAYDDVRCKYPLSNRESGDGRYDILVEKPDTTFIFEFKASATADDMEQKAAEALTQIEVKRYDAGLDAGKRLVRVGVAFHGKTCKVRCNEA